MTTPRDPDQLIHAFLLEGEEELHDRVYDAVRAEIEQKRQGAFIGPWRTPIMNRSVTIGLTAAAVLIIAVVAINLLPSSPGPGGAPSESPSASPSSAPSMASSASPEPPPPLTQHFTSTLYGYSVSYPAGWIAEAATEQWADEPNTFPVGGADPGIGKAPQIDWLYDPSRTNGPMALNRFVSIASEPIGDSTPDDWVAAQMAIADCGTPEPITVDSASGLWTNDCHIAVVTTAGRGYWIQLMNISWDLPPAPIDEDAWFEEILATVQLHPEDAVD
jgi:hypothetical protein